MADIESFLERRLMAASRVVSLLSSPSWQHRGLSLFSPPPQGCTSRSRRWTATRSTTRSGSRSRSAVSRFANNLQPPANQTTLQVLLRASPSLWRAGESSAAACARSHPAPPPPQPRRPRPRRCSTRTASSRRSSSPPRAPPRCSPRGKHGLPSSMPALITSGCG